jgi:hypothetical protein
MSSYYRKTKHPKTGEWERASWLDNLFGGHHYGVIFPSDEAKRREGQPLRDIAFDPEKVDLETEQE